MLGGTCVLSRCYGDGRAGAVGAEKRGSLTSSGELIQFQGRERRITHLKIRESRYTSSEENAQSVCGAGTLGGGPETLSQGYWRVIKGLGRGGAEPDVQRGEIPVKCG